MRKQVACSPCSPNPSSSTCRRFTSAAYPGVSPVHTPATSSYSGLFALAVSMNVAMAQLGMTTTPPGIEINATDLGRVHKSTVTCKIGFVIFRYEDSEHKPHRPVTPCLIPSTTPAREKSFLTFQGKSYTFKIK